MHKIAIATVLVWLFWTNVSIAQKVDTVIYTDTYASYYSYQLKDPLYVVYQLYRGGGECSRASFHFLSDSATADAEDYKKQGYDKGHLANAEDFAYDCTKERTTFSYYNCLPQTPRLNRGIWKTWETKIRNESQQFHLKIICGGIFYNSVSIGSGVSVPSYCWKIVINEDSSALIHCLLFPNDNSDSYQEIKLDKLKTELGFSLKY